ncbi:MAG: His/Gly/Thr/Pro-type tRNA ligase C-terminal domain-containing protein, partial [Planctomycetales bacterium]
RTTEFLWQEGHTAHATREEAEEETRLMLKLYADFAENYMAMPVLQGEKPEGERFPGAVSTLSIEAMMQDRKALQSGTSHFLGQNFSRVQNIKYLSDAGKEEFAWTTSWGVSTRLIGGLIMTHSDDDGLILPPKLAPTHIVILPIYRKDDDRGPVSEYCDRVAAELRQRNFAGEPIQVEVDNRDLRGGEKVWGHVKRGVPIRLEIGPRDMQSDSVFLARRDKPAKEKSSVSREEFVAQAASMLEEIQSNLFERAKRFRDENTRTITELEDFKRFFTPKNAGDSEHEIHGGFAECHWKHSPEVEKLLKELKVTIRCVPVDWEPTPGKCVFTGEATDARAVFAKAY